MRKAAILLAVLCACNSLLGISDVPQHECESQSDCAANVNRKVCGARQRCVTEFRVTGADPTLGLTLREQPRVADNVVGEAADGTTLGIVCQTNRGDQAEGKTQLDQNNQPTDIPFTTWDEVDDNSWVYDWYMSTPKIVQGYSPGIDHCPGE